MHNGKFGISISSFWETNISFPDKRQALGLKCDNYSSLTAHIQNSP